MRFTERSPHSRVGARCRNVYQPQLKGEPLWQTPISKLDLEELERQTSAITANLRAIDEDDSDLDELVQQTTIIVTNLRVIEEQR